MATLFVVEVITEVGKRTSDVSKNEARSSFQKGIAIFLLRQLVAGATS